MSAGGEYGTGQFEERLREGLERLARGAPPGPAAADLLRWLDRRRRRRVIASAGALLFLAAAAVFVAFSGAGRQGQDGGADRKVAVTHPAPDPAIAPSLPEPLDPRAGDEEIREGLRGILGPLDSRNLSVAKDPGDPISFAVGGANAPEAETLRPVLDRLLVHFDSARIEVLGGNLSWSLMR